MSQIEYRNRSISQLVQQLNNLGKEEVLVKSAKLLAVHETDTPQIRRFRNTMGQQFFVVPQNSKKYFYDQITPHITKNQIIEIFQNCQKGFDTAVIMNVPEDESTFANFIYNVLEVMGEIGEVAVSACSFGQITSTNMFSQQNLYYKIQNPSQEMIKKLTLPINSIKIIKFRSLALQNTPELTIITLPQQFFQKQQKNAYLSTVNNQLTQILNYISLNEKNRYESFSKLLAKRLAATNVIAELILQKSVTYVVNWIDQGRNAAKKMAFFDKIKNLSSFLKISVHQPCNLLSLPSKKKQVKSPSKKLSKSNISNIKSSKSPIKQMPIQSQQNDLQFCRTLERKTHRFSVNTFQEQKQSEDDLFRQKPITSRSKKQSQDPQYETQQILKLKALHAVEVSQYHQTIQNQNRKIQIIIGQKNLTQLYSIHEKEIMLLELKISQLRNDIYVLTNNKDDKSMKGIIRKINEEVKRMENKNSYAKTGKGKTMILEKEIKELKEKLDQNQKNRKLLALELETVTKRLKIRDAQIMISDQYKQIEVDQQSLSYSDKQFLRQAEVLIRSIKEGHSTSGDYLRRKIVNFLADMSKSRQTILECNDFLVSLQDHLQNKLADKDPEIVLDCNKFIRTFLIETLAIF